jgi:glycosyltransferase involved in cell wall biosynthesis
MVDLYNAHDALIHPSMLEGLPNVICEAMACARPVLAGNVCDHAILVEDGTRGFLFDPYKPEDIAAKIHQFKLLTPSQRAGLGQHGLEYARRELSMDAYVEAYLQLFRDLLDHS